MTVPTDDLGEVRTLYPELERLGYDRAFSFEAKHDPFLPLAVAGEHTTSLELGTAIAIAFARTPMTLANAGWDLQTLTGGRFTLGLGSQVQPHIEQRFSMPWSEPAERMREMVQAIRSIWHTWETGERLSFAGRFYNHTRMIPAFDPGPNPWGTPPIFTAGIGPRMTEVGGEVADGFLVHPLNTRKSLQELTIPSLARGAVRAGRDLADVEVVCVTIIVTGRTEEAMAQCREITRRQLGFYGSTPAYRTVFEIHDRGELHPRLKSLASEGRWDAMAELIDDEFLETVCVVAEPTSIATAVKDRLEGISNSVSLVNNRSPDPRHFAEAVAELRTEPPGPRPD